MRTIMQPDLSQYFDQAMQTFDTALQAGVQLQGETMRWWSEMLQEANSLQQLQHRAQSMMTEVVPNAQQHAGQYLSLFNRGYQTSLDLLRRAFEPSPSASTFEARKRMRELWQESFDSLYINSRDLVRLHMRCVEIWAEVADRNVALGAKAAKTGAQASHASTAKSKAKPGARKPVRGAHSRSSKQK